MEASSSSSRTIEITVLSGENLRLDRKLVKKNTFVTVETDPFNRHTTRIDTLGGSYPSWNDKHIIELPMHARFISLEVQCKTSSGNRSIGYVKIPVSDFIGGYVPENYLHFLSYRLRDAKWEKNGIINISVKVKTPTGHATSSSKAGSKVSGYESCSSQVTGLKLQGYASYSSQAVGSNVQGYASYMSQAPLGVPVGEVATGVPLAAWCANRA